MTATLTWHPPRTRPPAIGTQWQDWRGFARFLAGRTRRDIVADVAAVEHLIDQWQHANPQALDTLLESARIKLRRRSSRAESDAAHIEALAIVSLIARDALVMKAYRVQLISARAMLGGCVAQMAAGEGKTLCVAIAASVLGLKGRPVHVITSNDYLASRDCLLMQPLFDRCKLSVSFVTGDTPPQDLPTRYRADVVYGTSKQLLADYLRDSILLGGALEPLPRRLWHIQNPGARQPVMRGLCHAIVDEADSVLIDEANTPLIISTPEENTLMVEAVTAARKIADQLEAGDDYALDALFRDIHFTTQGQQKLDSLTRGAGHTDAVAALWQSNERRHDLISQAIIARDVFERDRHYIIDEGKVLIVDENTGRVMHGRSWSNGLHQAIEAREGVDITQPTRTLSRMSFQQFFRAYHHLCGASGTLQGIKFELWRTYGLTTHVVPPRVPSQLRVLPPQHFNAADDKWPALLDTVIRLRDDQHPVLVGTRKLADSERLQAMLTERGIPCAVLNAKHHKEEADIIREAGEPGRVTVATNMAGRGTDILLAPGVADAGGLQVLMMEAHESARVDWQLFGRAGRQGSKGRAHPFVALEDDLFKRHLPFVLQPLLQLARKNESMRARLVPALLWCAQQHAQWHAATGRKQLQRHEEHLKKSLSFSSDRPEP